jgi:hypothetical protein
LSIPLKIGITGDFKEIAGSIEYQKWVEYQDELSSCSICLNGEAVHRSCQKLSSAQLK